MKIRIKYFDGATKLKKIEKGNWIDVYSRKDILVSAMDISGVLNREPGNYLSDIMLDIENKIINLDLDNDKEKILDYVKNIY